MWLTGDPANGISPSSYWKGLEVLQPDHKCWVSCLLSKGCRLFTEIQSVKEKERKKERERDELVSSSR